MFGGGPLTIRPLVHRAGEELVAGAEKVSRPIRSPLDDGVASVATSDIVVELARLLLAVFSARTCEVSRRWEHNRGFQRHEGRLPAAVGEPNHGFDGFAVNIERQSQIAEAGGSLTD